MENFSPNNFEDDHILARYWLVLIRRWWIVGIVFIVVFGSGIVYAKTRPPLPFPHITTIEIGRIADGQALEDIRMVESKMKKAYIPIILQEHANKNGYDQKRYSIEIEIPEEGNTLILRADGDQNETETLLTLEQKIVDLLIEDHQQKSGLMKNELAQQQFDAKLRLDYLIEQGQLMPHKRQLIEETGQLLKRQIETVANLINAAEKDRAAALASAIEKGSVDQSLTTAILLMNETISENREKLRGLEERYYITLQNQRTEIDKEELENKRQQKEQEQNQDQQSADQQQQDPAEKDEQEKAAQAAKEETAKENDDKQQEQQQAATPRDDGLTTEERQAMEQWLRRVPDDPGGLLRNKFNYEHYKRNQEILNGEWSAPENGAENRW